MVTNCLLSQFAHFDTCESPNSVTVSDYNCTTCPVSRARRFRGDVPLQHALLPAAREAPLVAVVRVLRRVRPRRADATHALRQAQEKAKSEIQEEERPRER